MCTYLNEKFDWNNPALVSQYDELPLWSSSFGSLLLEHIPIRKYNFYLDIGSGTGFPLIDISQRLGKDCKAFGIDPWKSAIERIRSKLDTLKLTNIELFCQSADTIPFPDNHFDLITSNLGINNFENPTIVLSECYRVLKPDSSFCLTTNLVGHFGEFYKIFYNTLIELELYKECSDKFDIHVNHRGTVDSFETMLRSSGFIIKNCVTSQFYLRYLNGTSFLNHSVIKSGFLPAWRDIICENKREQFFTKLESNLNQYSEKNGELKLTVPMLYMECTK